MRILCGFFSLVMKVDPMWFERLMKINYLGVVYSILSVIPFMKQQRRGRVVVVGSLGSLLGCPGTFVIISFCDFLFCDYVICDDDDDDVHDHSSSIFPFFALSKKIQYD